MLNSKEKNLRAALSVSIPSTLTEFVDTLTPAEIDWLLHDWLLWAREDQLPPFEPAASWTNWMLIGGRGAGKTRAGAEWVRAMALGLPPFTTEPARRIALVGETLGDVRSVMIEGDSGLLAIHTDDERPTLQISKQQLVWPNGTIAQMFSSETPDKLRGPQFHAAWCDEICKWQNGEATWDMLQFGLRLGPHPRQVITTTPRNIPLMHRLIADKGTVVTRSSTFDNEANLAPSFLEAVVSRYGGTWLGRQELDGSLLSEVPGALWVRSNLDANRRNRSPELETIVVAVDPPATSKANADLCGIVIVGKAGNEFFVLADRSVGQQSPLSWALRVVESFDLYEADRLVVEINQGGEMVEALIRQIDPEINYRAVYARQGKRKRAEPVAALYEQGRVHHVGRLDALEDQMCMIGPDGTASGKSPDRVDALVWAINALNEKQGILPRVSVFGR